MGRKPAVCTMGGAKFCRFALFPLMLLMLLLLPAGMVAQKAASSSKYIATYESSTQTLTFKEFVGETLPKNSAWVEDKQTVDDINNNLGNCTIVHIVFDKSFSTYTPTSLYCFFEDLKKLETITGLEYLNTEKVTDMYSMFYNCSSLTSLDVTHFNTANVTNMSFMFASCGALTTIYVSDKFVTDKVTKGSNMFNNCKNLKGFISSKTGHTFANYKTGYFTKLVGKNGDEKIGATGETLATDNLVLDDDKDFVAYEPFAAKAASYSRTINAGTTWATLCLPFEVSLANQNFRAFKLLSADDVTETVELDEIEGSIAAGTPVIIKMKDGATELKFSEVNKEIANEVKTAETANGNYQLQGLYTQKEFGSPVKVCGLGIDLH